MPEEAVKGKAQDLIPVRRALISVADKNGLDSIAKLLAKYKVEILSTGGTANAIRQLGIAVTDVSDYTGFPEIQNGRVKTLHPKIHGALLGVRGNENHEKEMLEHSIQPIDLVIVNLYPFEETVNKGMEFDLCVENIDIGGPSMIRSSAKNHSAVAVITDTSQYPELTEQLSETNGATNLAFRTRLAAQAFARTAQYDAAIANYLSLHP